MATSFLKNVVVGSNEVFTAPKCTSHLTNSLPKGSKGSDQDKPRRGGGPPREYEMVRAARRNWLAASSLSGIGPLSRMGVSNLSGIHSVSGGGVGR